jgi:hypothetical protein
MCRLQGADGQWWWHYDARTGRIVEKYPVYSVHQDAMGPMALFALENAGGPGHDEAVERSLHWLFEPTEINESLVDARVELIWRKVARREPNKLSRTAQALASRVHSALRVPGVDAIFPPESVDFESRPYHMAWLLHAWSAERVGRLSSVANEATADISEAEV